MHTYTTTGSPEYLMAQVHCIRHIVMVLTLVRSNRTSEGSRKRRRLPLIRYLTRAKGGTTNLAMLQEELTSTCPACARLQISRRVDA